MTLFGVSNGLVRWESLCDNTRSNEIQCVGINTKTRPAQKYETVNCCTRAVLQFWTHLRWTESPLPVEKKVGPAAKLVRLQARSWMIKYIMERFNEQQTRRNWSELKLKARRGTVEVAHSLFARRYKMLKITPRLQRIPSDDLMLRNYQNYVKKMFLGCN